MRLRLLALTGRPDLPEPVAAELEDVAGVCHEAYRDVREAILGLREADRGDRTLIESLGRYAAAFSRQNGIVTRFTTVGPPDLALEPGREVQVLRIVQEALTNARKHSGARHIRVHVASDDVRATFSVTDDGRGFDPATLSESGFGLSTMRERAESVDGRLEVDTGPGRGTRVLVAVPARDGVAA